MADLSLSLKKALPEADVKALLEEADWGQGRTTNQIGQLIHSSNYVFSVWEGTKLAAFARALTDGAYVVFILDFIVSRTHQGRGVGSRLMKAILGHPDLLGINKWVVFSPHNQDFFTQFNFEPADDVMIRYG